MKPSPAIRRRVQVAGSLVLLVLVAGGCNGVTGTTAATVDGHRISTGRVFSLLKDRQVAADRQGQAGTPGNLAGPGKDTYSKRAFVDTLNQMIIADLVNDDLARRHLTVKRSDLTSAEFSLGQDASTKATLAKLPKGMKDFVVRLSAAQSVLQKQVGSKSPTKEAQARAQYAQIAASSPEQLRQLCITGAAFATKADATTARARMVKGATVTAAVSGLQVQQVAPKEQCATASQFPAAVQSLAAKGVSAPISNQGTFVVLRLERRKTLSFADVRSQIEAKLPQPGTAQLQAEIGKLVAKAKVHVDPRYGIWNRQAGKAEPPAGTPTTLAPPTTAPVTTPSGSAGTAGG